MSPCETTLQNIRTNWLEWEHSSNMLTSYLRNFWHELIISWSLTGKNFVWGVSFLFVKKLWMSKAKSLNSWTNRCEISLIQSVCWPRCAKMFSQQVVIEAEIVVKWRDDRLDVKLAGKRWRSRAAKTVWTVTGILKRFPPLIQNNKRQIKS